MAKDPQQSQAGDILASDFDWYGTSVGGTAYAVSMDGVGTSYNEGRIIAFRAGSATVGTATLSVNSIGAKNIKIWDFGGLRNLAPSELLGGQLVTVTYDATNDCFILMNPAHENARVARGTVSNNTSVTTSTGAGTDTDTTVTHALGTTPKLVTISARVVAGGAANTRRAAGTVSYDASGNIANGSFVSVNNIGSLSGSAGDVDVSAGSNMTVQGGGSPNATITISVVSITATTFIFRINGKNSATDPGSSTVTSINWTAIA